MPNALAGNHTKFPLCPTRWLAITQKFIYAQRAGWQSYKIASMPNTSNPKA
jgi:hypothetical protein